MRDKHLIDVLIAAISPLAAAHGFFCHFELAPA
jgi:hypothetical protein